MNWKLELESIVWQDEYEDGSYYDEIEYNFDKKLTHIPLEFEFKLRTTGNEEIENISLKSLKEYFYILRSSFPLERYTSSEEINVKEDVINYTIKSEFDISNGACKENEEIIIHMLKTLREYTDLTVFLDELKSGFDDNYQFTDTDDEEEYEAYAPYREFYKYFREIILKSLTEEEKLLIESKQI